MGPQSLNIISRGQSLGGGVEMRVNGKTSRLS